MPELEIYNTCLFCSKNLEWILNEEDGEEYCEDCDCIESVEWRNQSE